MEMIYTWTGNPFVDTGVAALCALAEKNLPEQLNMQDVKGAVEFVTQLYPPWASAKGGGFTKVFHNFSPFNFSLPTQESFKEELISLENEFIEKHGGVKGRALKDEEFKTKKKEIQQRIKRAKKSISYREEVFTERYKKFMSEALPRIKPLGSGRTCSACGLLDATSLLQRDKHPLLGSGDLVNYFSFFESGLGFCGNCALVLQFAPLALVQIKNWLCLIHSHESRIMLSKHKGIARRALEHFRRSQAAGKEISFFNIDLKARNLSEAVVRLAVDLTEDVEILGLENVAIRLYSFSNAGQTANVSFVDLPAPVFRFIAHARQRGLKNDLEELFKHSGFGIFERLTENESIRYFFFNREKKAIRGGWRLFELYLREIDEMDKDKLQTIISVANRIYNYIQRTNLRVLKEIEQANYPEFRRVLVSIHKVFPVCTAEELPIILSFEDWNETRDLLLFRIYECQHTVVPSDGQADTAERRIRLQGKLSPEFQKRIQIADRIFDYCVLQNHKNRLDEIEQAKKYPEFRKILLAVQKEILICMADELPLLFPKDESGRVFWEEVRDMLLFRIYERKHQISSSAI